MSGLSHLDELEAEAIYALLHRKGQLGNAAPRHESILPGEAAFPIFTYRYDLEIP